jgi:hypothetical protein
VSAIGREAIKQAIFDALGAIAPEADLGALVPGQPIRDQLDIDSFDFLNVIIKLHQQLGVEIPETDYARLATLDGALDYLAAKTAAR